MITVNNYSLYSGAPAVKGGKGVCVASGDNNVPNDINLYFGNGSNRIVLTGNSFIPPADTSFSFIAPIRFTNIQLGDTINISNGFTLNWSGVDNGYAIISIISNNVVDPTVVKSGTAIVNNNGSYNFSSNKLGYFTNDFYDITITRYEPKFIELANGFRIAVIGESSETLTVYFKH